MARLWSAPHQLLQECRLSCSTQEWLGIELPAIPTDPSCLLQSLKEHTTGYGRGGGEIRSCKRDEEGVAFLEVHPWRYCDDLSFLDGEAASVNKQQVPIRQLCVTSKWNTWLAPTCPCFPSCVCHPAWVIS